MGVKLGGQWLDPKPGAHECPRPYLWFAKEGQRWQCGKCGKIWVVERDADGRIWLPEDPEDASLAIFELVDKVELDRVLAEELDADAIVGAGSMHPVQTVVGVIRKHFDIGRKA